MYEDIFQSGDKCNYHFYWLRDSYEGSVFKVCVANSDYKNEPVGAYNANYSGIGVRPAICVSIEPFLAYINGGDIK